MCGFIIWIPTVIERQLAFDFDAIQGILQNGFLHLTQAFAPRPTFRNRIGAIIDKLRQ